MVKLEYYEIHDECTNKILFIIAHSLEQAIELSEKINFDDYNNLAVVDFF